MGLKEKFIKNSFFNSAGWLWLVFLNIVTVPYIVHKLGYEAYGVYALVLMVLGYFAFLDFGLCDAIIKYCSHYYALKDFEKMNKIINSILFLYVLIGLTGAGGIILFTKYFALKLFKVPPELHQTAEFCFYCGAAGFFLNLVLSVMTKIPESLQRFDISNTNNVITGSTVTLSNVLVLFLGGGLKELVLVNIGGSLLGIALFMTASRRLVGQLRFNFRFNYHEVREVFNFGLYTVFTRLSGVIMASINQLFVGALVGPSGVTIFNVPFNIVSRFMALIYRIGFIIFPVSSELHAQADHQHLQEVYLRLSKYLFLLSTVFFIPLMAYAKEILHYWMGERFAAEASTVMPMCCLAFYLTTSTMVPSLVALGLGKPRYNAFFSLLTLIINIGVVYPLTKAWGVNGAAFALFLSSLQAPLAIYAINRNIVKVDSRKYFLHVFGRSGLTAVAAMLFFSLVLAKLITGLLSLIIILGLSYLMLASFCYFFGLLEEDRVLHLMPRLSLKP